MLFLVVCILISSKTAVTDKTLASNLNSTNQEEHVVTIRVKTLLRSSRLYDITLTNTQDLDNLTSSIRLVNDTVYMFISSPSIQPITLQLKKRELIIAKDLMVRYSNKVTPIQEFEGLSLESCHFTGNVLEYKDSEVTLDMCQCVSGEIVMETGSATIRSVIKDSQLRVLLVYPETTSKVPSVNNQSRLKRETKFYRNTDFMKTTRFVEIYMSIDHSLYVALEMSARDCLNRAKDVIEQANTFFILLNVHLVLVGIEIWDTGDRVVTLSNINSTSTTLNSEELLEEYRIYREKHIWLYFNDVSVLLTNRALDYSVHSSINTMCSSKKAVVAISDSQESVTSIRLVHELGHLLGLEHVEEQRCRCVNAECVMAANINYRRGNWEWSECSINNLKSNFQLPQFDSCLRNKPRETAISSESKCGNYIVDQGEACDCGPEDKCESNCCDARRCQLKGNARCATGACCNKMTCTLKARNNVCRPTNNPQCDQIELCDGLTEWCPADSFKRNGSPCFNEAAAYCFNGACHSHKSQCSVLFGAQASNAHQDCYRNLNWMQAMQGNCGWRRVVEDIDKVSIKYSPCDLKLHSLCGQLHCDGSASIDQSAYQQLSVSDFNFSTVEVYGAVCRQGLFDVENGEIDPGQVPNGAKCGDSKMCVNKKCVSTASEAIRAQAINSVRSVEEEDDEAMANKVIKKTSETEELERIDSIVVVLAISLTMAVIIAGLLMSLLCKNKLTLQTKQDCNTLIHQHS